MADEHDITSARKLRKAIEALIRTYDNVVYVTDAGNTLTVRLEDGRQLCVEIQEPT